MKTRLTYLWTGALLLCLLPAVHEPSFAGWNRTNGPTGPKVTAFTYVSQHLFAGTENNGIYVSTDSGEHWTLANTGLTDLHVQILDNDGSYIYTVDSTGLHRSGDLGKTWTLVGAGLPNQSATTLASISDTLFAGTGVGVFFSTDHGLTWSATQPLDALAVNVHDLAVVSGVLIAGTGIGIYRSIDEGRSWLRPDSIIADEGNGLPVDVTSLTRIGTRVFACAVGGFGSALISSYDMGSTWQTISSLATSWHESDGSIASDGTALYTVKHTWDNAGDFTDQLLVSRDGGATFTPVTGYSNLALGAFTSVEGALFLGSGQGLWRSTDGGGTWQTDPRGMVEAATVALGSVSGNLLASSSLSVFAFDPVKNAWTLSNGGTGVFTSYLNAAGGPTSFANVGRYIVCGRKDNAFGDIRRSTDGYSWDSPFSHYGDVSSVTVESGTLFVGTDLGVFSSSDTGRTLAPIGTGVTNIRALAVSGNSLLAGTSGNGILKSQTDGSTNWEASNQGLPSDTATVTSLAVLAGTVYAGMSDGVYSSTDQGSSWTKRSQGASVADVQSLYSDGESVFAGTSSGAYYLSPTSGWSAEDSGLTEKNITALFVYKDSLCVGTASAGVWLRSLDEIVAAVLPRPVLSDPADGTSPVSVNPRLSWNPVPSASQYEIQVSSTGLFSSVDRDTVVSDTTYQIAGLDNSTTYYWRVRAMNAGGVSCYARPSSFTTVLAAPAQVQLVEPANGVSIGSDQVTFAWHPSAPEIQSYELTIVGDSTEVNTTTDTTMTVKIPAAGTMKSFTWKVRAQNAADFGRYSESWTFVRLTTSAAQQDGIPKEYALYQNYPNPFNPTTKIRYALPKQSSVSVRVYNALGQEVRSFTSGIEAAGYHEMWFDGSGLASGLYFYRIRAGEFGAVKSMLLVK